MLRKLFLFLIGLLMLASMLGLLFFAGAIYDSQEKHTIETFFWEPNSQSKNRVSAPVSADDTPDKFLRDSLIARFMNEYFYVIPDTNNANARAEFVNTDGTLTALRGLSQKSVSSKWRNTIAPEIQDMAARGAMRQVEVLEIADAETGHLVVNYRLKTWNEPNNLFAMPDITYGSIYLNVTRDPIHVNQTKEVLDLLRDGTDPAAAFAYTFQILDVPQQ